MGYGKDSFACVVKKDNFDNTAMQCRLLDFYDVRNKSKFLYASVVYCCLHYNLRDCMRNQFQLLMFWGRGLSSWGKLEMEQK